MKTKTWARRVTSPLPWLLAAALALGASAPAASASGWDRQADLSWASYQPTGWSAGSVARGTGYQRPGASLRVRDVQRRLDRLGYPTGKVDGFFGPITDAAVRQYQRENALEVDGIVGPHTLYDLRSRTRRAQGSADGQTSAAKSNAGVGRVSQGPAWSEKKVATSSPKWWTLVPLLAALLALALVAAGLLLRALTGFKTAAPSRARDGAAADGVVLTPESRSQSKVAIRQAEPVSADHAFLGNGGEERALEPVAIARAPVAAGVAAVGSDGRKSRPVEPVASRDAGRGAGRLRIVSRVERNGAARPARARGPAAMTTPRRRFERSGDPPPFRVLGARVNLSQAQPLDSPGTLLVELELFVEGHLRRWETGLIEAGRPFRVSLEDLEESVRALVVPDYLPALADALVEAGLEVSLEELGELMFALEPSIEVERVIAERGCFQSPVE